MSVQNLSGKTLLLGIGAQKCGTSWFYNYLKGCDDVILSPLKEIHFFDSLYRPDLCAGFNEKIFKRLKEAIIKCSDTYDIQNDPRIKALIDRTRMIYSDSAYLEHFASIVPIDISNFCEITPSYSLLREDGFDKINHMMISNSIDIKIFMLLRDPVSRHWSQIRFDARRSGVSEPIDNFRNSFSSHAYVERTFYHHTINSLLKIFDRSKLYFEFYENLFEEDNLRNLMDFLGLNYIKPNFKKRINPSPYPYSLSKSDIEFSVKQYFSVYKFCNEFFEGKIPDKWKQRMKFDFLKNPGPED